jgi:hypothetical protein
MSSLISRPLLANDCTRDRSHLPREIFFRHFVVMTRSMKLYNHSQAPNPRRVRIFAAEKGIELALEEVDILAGQKPHA